MAEEGMREFKEKEFCLHIEPHFMAFQLNPDGAETKDFREKCLITQQWEAEANQ